MPQAQTHPDYGQELLRIREALAITQREFATQLGTTSNTISRYECGHRAVPEPTMRLARALLPQRARRSS